MAYCSYCHLEYSDDPRYPEKDHMPRHRRFMAAEKILGRLPRSYEEREEIKAEAHRVLHSSKDFQARYQARKDVLRTHFERSVELAIDVDYLDEHPHTFAGYAHYYPRDLVEPEFVELLNEEFGYTPGIIDPRDCYFRPLHERKKK